MTLLVLLCNQFHLLCKPKGLGYWNDYADLGEVRAVFHVKWSEKIVVTASVASLRLSASVHKRCDEGKYIALLFLTSSLFSEETVGLKIAPL